MKIAIISFFILLLGGLVIALIEGVVAGNITTLGIVPMIIPAIVIIWALIIVIRNGIYVSQDKVVIAIQITGMILVLLGLGPVFFQEYFSLPIELIWASFAGLVLLMSSKYIELYRMMH